MERRDFLKVSGGLSAYVIVGGSLWSVREAEADTGLPIAALQASLDPKNDVLLVHGSKAAAARDVSYNQRTQLSPRVRVVAASAAAVGATIRWATSNGIGFAIRSGGHSYEGFSQSPDLVIDVRGMTAIKLSADKQSVSIGSGSSLGSVYDKLAPSHLAIPAGTCFPVGVAGHSLGGGFGLLGRAFGLACDNVLSMEMVDASGQIRNVSDQENPDLFWALRGGGNGSFGVVTNFTFSDQRRQHGRQIRNHVEQARRTRGENRARMAGLACGFVAVDHLHASPDERDGGIDDPACGRVVGGI
jgi:FAD/FMN-containing dehydrogenase